MRNACFKALLLALSVTAWATSTNQAQAQQETTLVNFNSTWKYNNSGTDLGTAWRAISYPSENSWSTGQGILGVEDAAGINAYQAIAPFNTQFSGFTQSTITYYFRTTFNFSGSPTAPGLQLFATNLVDDGCVIYLNGSVAGSVRMPTSYTYTTLASGGPAAEGQRDVVTISPSLLRSGVNTIAVEVHQSSATSSDVAFGMRLVAFTPQALVITNQPQSQSVSAGDPVTFTVGVQGSPVIYRWQKDGANLNSTSNTLTIASVQAGNAGNYRVIVSNAVNAVTSSIAVLTVVADTEGPKVSRAIIDNGFGTNSINVIFDEPLNSPSARTITNYRLVPVSNPNVSVQITNILYSTALGSLLQISNTDPNWNPRGSYYLILNRIADAKLNNIAPNTVVGVSLLNVTNLTQMADHWDFYANAFFDPAWPALYGQFHRTNFVVDPIYWGTSPGDGGIFWFDGNATSVLCAGDSLGRQVSDQDAVPTLFRRTFRLPQDYGRTATLRVRYMVDDGFVLYLNGLEITRQNIAAGPLTENSRATQTIGNPTCVTNLSIVVTNLLPGTNWLAAAVHQGPTTENDIYFGLEMDAVNLQATPTPTNRPPGTPTIVRNILKDGEERPTAFVLSWPATNYGYTLQYSTDISGSGARPDRNWWTNQANWIQVSDQANPYTNALPPSSGPRRYYRLHRETLN